METSGGGVAVQFFKTAFWDRPGDVNSKEHITQLIRFYDQPSTSGEQALGAQALTHSVIH